MNSIKETNHFLLHELINANLVFTIDGLFENPKYIGSSCIVNNKVYRPIKFVKIGNWLDWLTYYKYNKETVNQIINKFVIDLDDDDCCADGILWVKNKNYEDVSVFVPFNDIVHKEIKSRL